MNQYWADSLTPQGNYKEMYDPKGRPLELVVKLADVQAWLDEWEQAQTNVECRQTIARLRADLARNKESHEH